MNIISIGIIGLVIVGFYVWYVSLIYKRNNTKEALSGIDVQLRKRADLIPNMLVLAKKYMQYEMEIMTRITELRTKTTQNYDPKDPNAIQAHFQDAEKLASSLGQFKLAVENYPDLKSNQAMLEAMESLNEIEAQIAAARRFYNSSVTELNNAVQIFPGNIIASLVNVKELPFYETDSASKIPIDASKF